MTKGDEEPNEGMLRGEGRRAAVRRDGDRVLRRRHRASAYVADVLALLSDSPHVPDGLGRDGDSDVVEYIPGDDVPMRAGAIGAVARMLGELHSATSGSGLADGAECVLHGDPSPDNVVMRGGWPVALIDWDYACPGAGIDDLAYLCWTWCLEGEGSVEERATRLREALDGYGRGRGATPPVESLLDAIERRQRGIELDAEWWARSTGADRARAEAVARWAREARETLSEERERLLDA